MRELSELPLTMREFAINFQTLPFPLTILWGNFTMFFGFSHFSAQKNHQGLPSLPQSRMYPHPKKPLTSKFESISSSWSYDVWRFWCFFLSQRIAGLLDSSKSTMILWPRKDHAFLAWFAKFMRAWLRSWLLFEKGPPRCSVKKVFLSLWLLAVVGCWWPVVGCCSCCRCGGGRCHCRCGGGRCCCRCRCRCRLRRRCRCRLHHRHRRCCGRLQNTWALPLWPLSFSISRFFTHHG